MKRSGTVTFSLAAGALMTLLFANAAYANDPTSVTINNDAFSPKTVTIKSGRTVTFVNKDDEAHTVTADDGSFDSKPMRGTFEHRFTKPGRYAYHCMIHPFMHGVIVVAQ